MPAYTVTRTFTITCTHHVTAQTKDEAIRLTDVESCPTIESLPEGTDYFMEDEIEVTEG